MYEAMVLLDNDVVREGYEAAKSTLVDTLQKYEATVHACRRWDERRLSYPIRRKNRATYFISYFEMPGDKIPSFRRELEFNENVLRYLLLAVDGLPEGEVDQAKAEEGADFSVPPPPEDDAIEMDEEAGETSDLDTDDDDMILDDKED